MIEPIMFIGIGFLVAGLLVIGVIPLVHARAVRLTARRLEALTPLSMAEIQADKDQLRAEFAMSTRRLEISVEQMKAKTTSQLAEIGKKSEAIGRLKLELGEKTAALFAFEAKETQLAGDVQRAQTELAAKASALDQAEKSLASIQAQLAESASRLDKNSVTGDSQRVELVAMRAQTEILKTQIDGYEKEIKELRDRSTRETANAEAARQQITEERGRTEDSEQPSRRARAATDRANNGIGGARPSRPRAEREAGRAGAFPRGWRIRLRPSAQRGGSRAKDPRRCSSRARAGGKPPPFGNGRDACREEAGRRSARASAE